MLHVNSPSQEEMAQIIKTYKLADNSPSHLDSPFKLAEYVFEACIDLIPNFFGKCYEESKDKKSIKMDLVFHMVLNAYMNELIENEGSVQRNSNLFTKVHSFLGPARTKSGLNDLIGEKSAVNLNRFTRKKMSEIGKRWELSMSSDTNYTIPSFIAPLVAFQTLHADIHKVVTDYKDARSSIYYTRKYNSRELHLDFYDNFKFMLDNFLSIEKIAQLFKDGTIIYHPTLNKILFEREYSLGLVSKISAMSINYSEEMRIPYRNLLSIVGMLPNVNGRLLYLTSLLQSTNAINGEEREVLSTWDEKLNELKKWSHSIIGLSTITIPVMEAYFIFLWQKKGSSLIDFNMADTMTDYDDVLFLDKRDEIEYAYYAKKRLFKTENVIGIRHSAEWALSELSFNKVFDVLKMVNEISDIQRHSIKRNIHLNPYKFLEEYEVDQLTIWQLERTQDIQGVISKVSDVIEENYMGFVFQ